MVSNVNSVSSAKFYEVSKPPDEKTISESNVVVSKAPVDTDKVEISNEAHTASINSQIAVKPATREFMEVFTVNFWSLGVGNEEQ